MLLHKGAHGALEAREYFLITVMTIQFNEISNTYH